MLDKLVLSIQFVRIMEWKSLAAINFTLRQHRRALGASYLVSIILSQVISNVPSTILNFFL
ncbi:hypothetical protein DMR38_13700 [Clostridium sp. AWRP]|nr:hypothetical protein DMR38_13700 [Clostridium sp. AWRP]